MHFTSFLENNRLTVALTGEIQDHIVAEFHDTASLISTSLSMPDARNTRMGC